MLQGVANLNPFTAYEDSEYVVFNLIYDRLITYDEDLNPIPLLAESWEIDDWDEADNVSTPTINEGANRLWRYHIVQNAFWHDGEPLTAEDVEYTINLNMDPVMWAFTPYINNRIVDHATAIDQYTVEVYLVIPNMHIDNLIIPIVPKHIWSQWDAGQIQYGSVDFGDPIGSGPFKFVDLQADQYVKLEKNERYHLGEVAYDELVFVFYGSDQVMAQDLRNGNIDVARFPPLTYDELKSDPDIETAEVKKYYQSTLGFNCFDDPTSKGNPLLRDENLRRAMHLAIDKQYIIDTIWRGYADIGYALPAPVVPEYHWEPSEEESLDFDPVRANALLNESGYDKWNNDGIRLVNTTENPYAEIDTPLSFGFMVRSDAPEDIAAAPYIKEMWQEIGVEVTIEPMEESAMETVIYYAAAHDAYMWYWSGDYDPTYILGVMTTDQIWGWNDPFWSNETYDQLYLEQLQQTGEERIETVFEMQRIWYESSGMICLSYPYGLYAWTEQHFTNWGDPTNHPGRTIDHYFGAAPLYMELEPVTDDGGEDEDGGGTSTALLAGVGAAIAIAIAVVALLVMKKRRGGATESVEKKEPKTGLE